MNTTKIALEASLKELLKKKPFDKITIADLTEDCGISRMAFYYHFKDIYDLVEGTVEEYVDSMNEVKEQEIERLKKVVQEKDEELSKVTQEKDEALTRITQEKDSEIARLKALLAAKENN